MPFKRLCKSRYFEFMEVTSKSLDDIDLEGECAVKVNHFTPRNFIYEKKINKPKKLVDWLWPMFYK